MTSKEGNTRINKVSPMGTGFPKVIEKVLISTNYESSEINIVAALNARCIDYTDTV